MKAIRFNSPLLLAVITASACAGPVVDSGPSPEAAALDPVAAEELAADLLELGRRTDLEFMPPEFCGDGQGGQSSLCAEIPPGMAAGQGNTTKDRFCLPPMQGAMGQPPLADAICEFRFAEFFRARAHRNALRICSQDHQVDCRQVDCPVACELDATLQTGSRGMYYIARDPVCQTPRNARLGLTASCTYGNSIWDCDCVCPDCMPPEIDPATLG